MIYIFYCYCLGTDFMMLYGHAMVFVYCEGHVMVFVHLHGYVILFVFDLFYEGVFYMQKYSYVHHLFDVHAMLYVFVCEICCFMLDIPCQLLFTQITLKSCRNF